MEQPVQNGENTAPQDMADDENIKPRRRREGKKPPKKITEKYLYNAGLAYLQRFPASTPHFRRLMTRRITRSCNYHKDQDREACTVMLESAISTFLRQGLLNDDAYLQGMINSYRRRGLSTQAILSKLQQKGLTSDAIQQTLRMHDAAQSSENPDLSAALLLTRRKRIGPFRQHGEPDRTKELAALARAGFGFDIAQKALAMNLDEAEGLIAL